VPPHRCANDILDIYKEKDLGGFEGCAREEVGEIAQESEAEPASDSAHAADESRVCRVEHAEADGEAVA
jgi:hypothetical protein